MEIQGSLLLTASSRGANQGQLRCSFGHWTDELHILTAWFGGIRTWVTQPDKTNWISPVEAGDHSALPGNQLQPDKFETDGQYS